MSSARFLSQTIWLSIVAFLISLAIARMTGLPDTLRFFITGIFCYFNFNTILFFYARNISRSHSPYSFNYLVVASFLVKLIMSLAILIFYNNYYSPLVGTHVMQFIVIYIIYAIHEVYFLTILVKHETIR